MEVLIIVLHCNNEELTKYIQSKGRYQKNKTIDLNYVAKKTKEKRLFIPEGAFEIDNSNLSAKEVAKKIFLVLA